MEDGRSVVLENVNRYLPLKTNAIKVASLKLRLLYHFSNFLKKIKEFTQLFLANLLSRQSIQYFIPDLKFH